MRFTEESVWARLFAILPPAFLIVANLFLFVPFVIYMGNPDEFILPFVYILRIFILPAVVLMAVLAIIGLILPSVSRKRYASLLFIIGLLVWIQSSFLVWNYGVFAGHGIDWSVDAWRGRVDGAVWVVLLGAGVFLFRYISRITSFASMALIGLQAAFLIALSIQTPVIWTKPMPTFVPQNELFEFSSKQNVVHVILDTFQSDIFEEIVSERPEHYRNKLDGFVFFREALSSFPTTVVSISSILTGELYKNDEKIRDFQDRMQTGKSFPDAMRAEGFELDLVGEAPLRLYGIEKPTTYYVVPVPYGVNQAGYGLATSNLMMDMTLFRSVPHLLKKYVYNDELWLVQRLLSAKTETLKQKGRNVEAFSNLAFTAFLSDFIKTSSVKGRKPVYKLLHLMTPHTPWVIDNDCVYAGKTLPATRENIKSQQRCALDGFIALLDKLRDIGVYDSALIIVNSDHGAGSSVKLKSGADKSLSSVDSHFSSKVVGAAAALLAVKPPGAKGPLKTSDAQVMLTDIPATVGAVLGLKQKFNGRSVFDVKAQETRDRRFYLYEWSDLGWEKDFFNHLDEYIIKGSKFDAASWRVGATLPPPGVSFVSKEIDFGVVEGQRFQRIGWGDNEKLKDNKTVNWAVGGISSVCLTLSKDNFTVLTAELLSYPFKDSQRVTVRVDGTVTGVWELQMSSLGWVKRSVVVPPDVNRRGISVIEFEFSRVKEHGKSGTDDRPLAALFDKITIEDVAPIQWGSKFSFGKGGNAEQIAIDGWSTPEQGFTWTSGKGAGIAVLANSAPRGAVLKAVIFPLLVQGKVSSQRVDVVVNGRSVGVWTLSDPAGGEYAVLIPGSLLSTANVLKVEFKTPDAVSPQSLGISGDTRVLGVAFRSITLAEAK